jgi:uncharacterized membrane protein
MNKKMVNIVAIVVGTLLSFILMRFLRNTSVPFNRQIGMALSHSIVAVFAIIFSPVAGGSVGLLSRLLLGLPYRIKLFGLMELILILIFGLYGFLIGKIYESNNKRHYDEFFIKKIGKIYCIILSMYIFSGVISSIVIQINSNKFSIYSLFLGNFLPILIYGFIVSIIGSVLTCICQKIFKCFI